MNARSGGKHRGLPLQRPAGKAAGADTADLPLLVVRDVAATPPSQKVAATPSSQTVPAPRRADQGRAIWCSYACHCTVPGINSITGDRAGYAMEKIQRDLPGAIALMSAGGGGDANPATAAATRPRACRRAGCRSPRRAIFGVLAALLFFSRAAFALESPLAPDDALKAFQHEPDVRVELVAAEPLVMSPCAITFDERGRLFVAENRGYPNTANAPSVVLERKKLPKPTDKSMNASPLSTTSTVSHPLLPGNAITPIG